MGINGSVRLNLLTRHFLEKSVAKTHKDLGKGLSEVSWTKNILFIRSKLESVFSSNLWCLLVQLASLKPFSKRLVSNFTHTFSFLSTANTPLIVQLYSLNGIFNSILSPNWI